MVTNNVSCTQPTEDADMLSKLPSDVLISILEKLSLRDAIRAGVLSRRWRRLPGQLPRLVLDFEDYLPGDDDDDVVVVSDLVVLSAAGDRMLDAATAVLASRQDQLPVCAMSFPLRHNYMSLCRLLDDAMAGGKVRAAELTISTTCVIGIDDESESTFRAMVGYGRQFGALFDSCPAAFGGLTRLTMERMTVREAVLDDILTTCTRLEFLSLEAWDAGRPTTQWRVRHARLADLRIAHCVFGAVHLVCLPRLERFAYRYCPNHTHQPLSFGHVPHLTTLTISNNLVAGEPTVNLSKILANSALKEIRLNFRGKDIWVQPEAPKQLINVFRNLKYLKVRNVHVECGLNWTMFLLQAAPSLKELYIKLWDHECSTQRDENHNCFPMVKKNVPWDSATEFKHYNLTWITIRGFYSTNKDILVTYICRLVQAAVNMDELYMRKTSACEDCDAGRTGFPWMDEDMEWLRKSIIDGRSTPFKIHFVES